MSDSKQDEHWLRLRGMMQERWPALTEEELDATGGNQLELEALLEMKIGCAPYIAHADLAELMEKAA